MRNWPGLASAMRFVVRARACVRLCVLDFACVLTGMLLRPTFRVSTFRVSSLLTVVGRLYMSIPCWTS